jgi:hypothetical protein
MAALPSVAPDQMFVRNIPQFFQIKGEDAQNVASNKTATLRIPPSGLHYEHYLRFLTAGGVEVTQAQIESEITNIRLKINGDSIIDLKPAEINMLQGYNGDFKGASVIAGIMKINFVPRNLPAAARKRYALGMAGITSVVYEITCGTLVNIAKVESYVVLTNETAPLGTHIRLLSQPITFDGTGDNWVTDLPKTPGMAFKAFHIDVTTGTLDYSTLTVDQQNIIFEVPAKVQQAHLENHYRNPQTNWRHYSFDQNDELMSFLPMTYKENNTVKNVNDLRLKNRWSVTPGGSYRVIMEQIHGLVA